MRIAVAMSGGVDSSAAAALLAEQGHEVVGLTLKVWESSRCCSIEDVADAQRVARRLAMPHYVLDAHAEFETAVVEPFLQGYAAGLTPNPCVLCNRRVKFRWLMERARALGCEVLATGHYARLESGAEGPRLQKGVDPAKDQSYFLVPRRRCHLDGLSFPLGGSTKAEVRRIARDRDLPVSSKPESQDVCFVPRGGLGRFLRERLGAPESGEVVDPEGRVVGRHDGIYPYTVGQRKGIGVSAPWPLYVVRRETDTNRLVVGPREALMAGGLAGRDAVWLSDLPRDAEFRCTVKIRSTGRDVPCVVTPDGTRVTVRFDEPQFGVAPGQAAVFYRGDTVVGGAWIETAMHSA